MDMVVDGIRWVLWLLCKGCFFLIDSIYNIIKPIICFDIGDSGTMWSWWTMLCVFIGFFIFLRLLTMFLKASVDEDYILKLEPMQAILRILAICAVLVMMPSTVKYFTALSGKFIAESSKIFNIGNNFANTRPVTGDPEKDEKIKKIYEEYEGMPSQLFISAASNGRYPPYQLIDINDTEGGLDNIANGIPIIGGMFDITSGLIGADGDYVFFPDTTMLIFLIVEAVCGAYMFVLMAIQISQRIVSIGVKVLMSPIPISGIVNPDDHSFGLWCKLLTADLVSNALQYLILLFVMALTSSPAIQAFGIVGQGIFFLGGMLAVLVGPGQVAQIIGGDGMGLFQTMQGFQTMSALKGMTQSGISTVAGAAGGAAALGVYGAGRAAGMQSLGNFPGAENGGKASSSGSPFSHGSGAGRNTPGSHSNIPPKAFSEKSTNCQRIAAKKAGFDATNMSKGDASIALEEAGLDKSFWSNSSAGKGFDGFNSGSATGTINSGNNTYGFDNTSHTSEPYASEGSPLGNGAGSSTAGTDTASQGTASQGAGDGRDVNSTRLSREGTMARRVGDSANLGSRAAVKLGRTAYFNAGNRLMGSRNVMRGGRQIEKNTRAQTLSNLHTGINGLRRPQVASDSVSRRDQSIVDQMEHKGRKEEEDL